MSEETKELQPFEPINLKETASRLKPGLAKAPDFLFKWIGRIIHIDQINSLLEHLHGKSGQEALESACQWFNMKMNLHGPGVREIEELAKSGKPVMFVSNHPFGGPEGILLFSYLHKLFPESKMLVQSYLQALTPLKDVCVFNKKELHTLLQAAKERRSLLFYPAGYCSRELSNGEVFDYDWKRTFVKIAKTSEMPIVTFFTEGSLTKRMLNWTKFRKLFHIKASIETIFLPDEMLKRRNTVTDITAGHVIYPNQLDNSQTNDEWALRIRQYCHDLKTNENLIFDPLKASALPIA